MASEPIAWSLDEWIVSDTAAGGRIVERLLQQMQRLGWCERDQFAVHLATEEALVNAIKHGNRLAADKRVHVVVEVNPERVWIQITDEGDGFDPNTVPDPREDDNLELPSGRGLMLMRSYMSSVAFNERGNQVTMEKFRSASSEDEDSDDDEDWFNDD